MTPERQLKQHLHRLVVSYYRQGRPLKELQEQIGQLLRTGQYKPEELQEQLDYLAEELGIQQHNTETFLNYLNLK